MTRGAARVAAITVALTLVLIAASLLVLVYSGAYSSSGRGPTPQRPGRGTATPPACQHIPIREDEIRRLDDVAANTVTPVDQSRWARFR